MATTIEKRMTRSGFCQYPSPGSHVFCHERQGKCDCDCHSGIEAFDDGVRIGEAPAPLPHDDPVDTEVE